MKYISILFIMLLIGSTVKGQSTEINNSVNSIIFVGDNGTVKYNLNVEYEKLIQMLRLADTDWEATKFQEETDNLEDYILQSEKYLDILTDKIEAYDVDSISKMMTIEKIARVKIKLQEIRSFSASYSVLDTIDANGNKWQIIVQDEEYEVTDDMYQFQDFYNGIAIVKHFNKFGFINYKGDLVVEPIYDEMLNFVFGYTVVYRKDKNKRYLVDKAGKIIRDISEYTSIRRIEGGFFLAKRKYGENILLDFDGQALTGYHYKIKFSGYKKYFLLCDKNTTKLFNAEYKVTSYSHRQINESNSCYFPFSGDNYKWGLMDTLGIEILAPSLFSIDSLYGGLFVFKKERGKGIGVINKNGAYYLEPLFDKVTYRDAKIYSQIESDVYIFSIKGRCLVGCEKYQLMKEYGRNAVYDDEKYQEVRRKQKKRNKTRRYKNATRNT